VFRYAIATGRAASDPVPALRGALVTHRTKHRAAITDPEEFGRLLRAIDSLERSPVVRSALQILALCFPRPGELRHAHWSEIDLEKSVWSIPAERTKMRRPHTVPLAPQAIKILTNLRGLTGDKPYVFPGVRTWRRPLSDNTFNASLRSLGFTGEEVTAHGFRTTASTLLNESGYWHPDAIERALAHQEPNAVRRAYARGEFWDERVRMVAWWADYVDAMRDNRSAPPRPTNAPTGTAGPLQFGVSNSVGQAPSITTSRGGLIFV
jgi:integrase